MDKYSIRYFDKTVNSLEDDRVNRFLVAIRRMSAAYGAEIKADCIHEGVVMFEISNEKMRPETYTDLLLDLEALTGKDLERFSEWPPLT